MEMPWSQYLRIESAAGGIGCTDRQFIRACHSKLMPSAKTRQQRASRHAWIRSGLATRKRARRLAQN